MYHRSTLCSKLNRGDFNPRLAAIYGCEAEQAQAYAKRYSHVVESFKKSFPDNTTPEIGLYSAPGRTEIGGNHTDHQLGCVLAGSVNLDAVAAAAPNGTSTIRFHSEGYSPITLSLDSLLPREEEQGTTTALIRGMAAKIIEMGYPVTGFDAYCTSNVLGGSGLSSSAAFETLTGVIINDLFCASVISAVTTAKIGQYTENVYFGKPSGLMDQMASSVGGIVAIDFGDQANPIVEKIDFDFAASGYTLCIIDSKSDHAELTHEYAMIPEEMGSIAAFFGEKHLRAVDYKAFLAQAEALRKHAGDRAFLRALHFFDDNRRAQLQAAHLKSGDFDAFLEQVNASGYSSAMYLQNTIPGGAVKEQAVTVALALCHTFLEGTGACRVHGGGFAGTIQAFVPNERLAAFKASMDAVLGAGSCQALTIRPIGGVAL